MSSSSCAHSVQFYGSDEPSLVENVSAYLAESLGRGENVLCISTPEHRDAFLRQLRANRIKEEDPSSGTMIFADASQAMSGFMRKGMPDPALFEEIIKPLVDQIAISGGTTKGRAYGEIVGLLWERGEAAAAIRVEQLWNELLRTSGIGLMCGYPIDVFSEHFHSPETRAILAEHSDFISSASEETHNATRQRRLGEERAQLDQQRKQLELERTQLEHERKQLEQTMREAGRLESLGLLAGGIAHDFNNLLTGILCSASMLQQDVPKDSAIYSSVDAIARASERASKLTRQMLAYAGRARFTVEPLNLARQTREILDLLRASIPKRILIADSLDERVPAIEADAGQIQQVVMNLVLNAAEATSAEGTISVTVSSVRLEAPKPTVTAGLVAGDYVKLEVRDQGSGMDEETKRKIFEPFFTTKAAGHGLGLAAVLGILKGQKAGLELESSIHQGSVFRIYFPVVGKPSMAHQSATPSAKSSGGTILMVDDDDVLLRVGKLALESLRFRVIVARDGEQALQQFQTAHAELVLVILDMTMPGLPADETLRHMKAIDPSVPVVGSSGYSVDEVYGRFGSKIAGFLQKPYAIQRLSETVLSAARPQLTPA